MKERIDHSNYEAWLLDRLEGNLTPEQDAQLDAFLATHPDLESGLEELPTLAEHDARLTQADKDALKRSLPPTGLPAEPIDDFLIARLEGDLSAAQLEALRIHLADHPEHQRTERLFELTKLVPEAMAYAEKKALARQLPPLGNPALHTLDDFLVARLEGDLTNEQLSALRLYLAHHPEHQHVERLYARTKLVPEAMAYPEKGSLERQLPPFGSPSVHKLDDFLVAHLEGQLNPEQERSLLTLLAGDARAMHQWTLMQRTRITAGTEVYPTKEGLKKGGKVIAIGAARASWAVRLRVAATVAVLLGAGIWMLTQGPSTGPEIAVLPSNGGSSQSSAAGVQSLESASKGSSPTAESGTSNTEPSFSSALGTVDDAGTAPVRMQEGGSIQRQEAPTLLAHRVTVPVAAFERTPVSRPVPEPGEIGVDLMLASTSATTRDREEGIPLRRFLAGKLRARVLDKEDDSRPLDQQDALAALDKGLRSVGGEKAGLDVERLNDGRLRSFNLRLGPNLTVSARR